MSDEIFQRRAAAILAIDTAGYSRLMHADEEGTHRRMMALMRQVVEPSIHSNAGHIVKKTGDGALVMFDQADQAAQCALAIQREMRRRFDPAIPEDRRIVFRIGINLGDIIIEPDDIYGDGVNIAARLEGTANPGTILVSESVARRAQGAIEGDFVDLGERLLKNIPQPMRVFGLSLAPGEAVAPLPTDGAAIPGFIGRPAVAVMPFVNAQKDPDQDFFVDGLTDDLIARLSSWRAFPVIARHSVFAYRAQSADTDPKSIGKKLGARYVVQGSVRRAAVRVRITGDVADASNGHVIMAERFERNYGDLFELQDEVANSVTGLIAPELLKVERERLALETGTRLDVYEFLMRALWHHYRYTHADNLKAIQLLREGLRIDPNNAQLMANLAVVLIHALNENWRHDEGVNYDTAFELAQRAVSLDARDAIAHFALALVCRHTRRRELDLPASREAVRLNPSYAAAYVVLAGGLNYSGMAEEGRAAVEVAMKLSPYDPRMSLWQPAHAMCLYQLRRYEEAIVPSRKSLAVRPGYVVPLRYLVASLGQLGRTDEASAALADLRKTLPTLQKAREHLARYYYQPEALEHVIEGLQKAGLTS